MPPCHGDLILAPIVSEVYYCPCKLLDLKSPRMNTYKNEGEGGGVGI